MIAIPLPGMVGVRFRLKQDSRTEQSAVGGPAKDSLRLVECLHGDDGLMASQRELAAAPKPAGIVGVPEDAPDRAPAPTPTPRGLHIAALEFDHNLAV